MIDKYRHSFQISNLLSSYKLFVTLTYSVFYFSIYSYLVKHNNVMSYGI